MNVMGKRLGDKECLVNTKATKTSQSLISFAQQIPYGLFNLELHLLFDSSSSLFFNQKEVTNFMGNFNFHVINVFKKISEISSCCIWHLFCLVTSILGYILVRQCFCHFRITL